MFGHSKNWISLSRPVALDTIKQTNESTKTEMTELSNAIENEEAEEAAVGSDEDDDLWRNTNRR
jgi:hypothetical protein